MTEDDVIHMVHVAGLTHYIEQHSLFDARIFKLAQLVADKEREACAKLAQETICDTHIPTGINIYGTRVAKAIRARSNT